MYLNESGVRAMPLEFSRETTAAPSSATQATAVAAVSGAAARRSEMPLAGAGSPAAPASVGGARSLSTTQLWERHATLHLSHAHAPARRRGARPVRPPAV